MAGNRWVSLGLFHPLFWRSYFTHLFELFFGTHLEASTAVALGVFLKLGRHEKMLQPRLIFQAMELAVQVLKDAKVVRRSQKKKKSTNMSSGFVDVDLTVDVMM